MTRTMPGKERRQRLSAIAGASRLIAVLPLLLPLLSGCGMLGGTHPAGNAKAPQPIEAKMPQPVDAAALIPKCQAIVRDTYTGQPVTYGPPSAAVNGDAATVTVPFMLPRADGTYGNAYAKYTCRFTGTALTGSGLVP